MNDSDNVAYESIVGYPLMRVLALVHGYAVVIGLIGIAGTIVWAIYDRVMMP